MNKRLQACAVLMMSAVAVLGCRQPIGLRQPPPPGEVEVPQPINLLLPRQVVIHPFTGARSFDETGGIRGIDARIQALDTFGDSTKAFGDFRFELYSFRQNNPDPKNERMAVWEVSLLDAQTNLTHWDPITRTYNFKLQWDSPIPIGRSFVLVATFSSPFTERLFAERVFVSGQ